jgi:5' nucleotidase, deoxy (Pyrimidine), cytosolic type C protein (NT5C)
MQLYVDMDGVLADFHGHYQNCFGTIPNRNEYDNVEWDQIRKYADWYLNIPPMPDMKVLWDYVSKRNPVVLTGEPKEIPESRANKSDWGLKHLIPTAPIVVCKSKNKSDYCNPGDVLIDDWNKYRHLWLGKGGIWITHTDAETTIKALRALGI